MVGDGGRLGEREWVGDPGVPNGRAVRLHRALDETRRLLVGHVGRAITELKHAVAFVATSRPPRESRLAEVALREVAGGEPAALVHASTVMAVVAEYYGCTIGDLRGPGRTKPVVRARQVAMYLCRELTGLSLPRIGSAFSRDHTTVLHAVQKIRQQLIAREGVAGHVGDLRVLVKKRAAVQALRQAHRPAQHDPFLKGGGEGTMVKNSEMSTLEKLRTEVVGLGEAVKDLPGSQADVVRVRSKAAVVGLLAGQYADELASEERGSSYGQRTMIRA